MNLFESVLKEASTRINVVQIRKQFGVDYQEIEKYMDCTILYGPVPHRKDGAWLIIDDHDDGASYLTPADVKEAMGGALRGESIAVACYTRAKADELYDMFNGIGAAFTVTETTSDGDAKVPQYVFIAEERPSNFVKFIYEALSEDGNVEILNYTPGVSENPEDDDFVLPYGQFVYHEDKDTQEIHLPKNKVQFYHATIKKIGDC